METAMRIALALVPPLSLLFNAGCSNLNPEGRMITIDSSPRGATLYADGREFGTTPQSIAPDHAFPPHWDGLTYRVNGTLRMERSGCEHHEQQVDDRILGDDIFVSLDCTGETARPAAATQSSSPDGNDTNPSTDALEQRLLRLERLRNKQLINEQEYDAARRRILDSL